MRFGLLYAAAANLYIIQSHPIAVALQETLWELNDLLSFVLFFLSISQWAIERLQAPHYRTTCRKNNNLTTLHFSAYFVRKFRAFCRSSEIPCTVLSIFDCIKTCFFNTVCMVTEFHIPQHHDSRQEQCSWVCFILTCYIRSCTMHLKKGTQGIKPLAHHFWNQEQKSETVTNTMQNFNGKMNTVWKSIGYIVNTALRKCLCSFLIQQYFKELSCM